MPNNLNQYQINKLGNTLIYLSKNVGDFGKTKALKLLFLLEEFSISELGVPFFGFDFKVWKFGPVVEEIYEDLSTQETPMLSSFIRRMPVDPDIFEPVKDFNDDEFSDNDIYLLDKIVNFARHKTAKDLVDYTHGQNSLWRKIASENGVLYELEKGGLTKTDLSINFFDRLESGGYLEDRYTSSLEFLAFNNHFKK